MVTSKLIHAEKADKILALIDGEYYTFLVCDQFKCHLFPTNWLPYHLIEQFVIRQAVMRQSLIIIGQLDKPFAIKITFQMNPSNFKAINIAMTSFNSYNF